jgi:hypothetical protein
MISIEVANMLLDKTLRMMPLQFKNKDSSCWKTVWAFRRYEKILKMYYKKKND